MKKSKPRKPITFTSSKPVTQSFKKTHQVISKYHTLIKQKTQLNPIKDEKLIQSIDETIKNMGGLESYQKASLIGANNKQGTQNLNKLNKGKCASAKWLIPHLKKPSSRTLRLLDVGAINGETYSKYTSWLHVDSIDLNPHHPSVKKQDFFEMEIPSESQKYDCVSLSLVINFTPSPINRGEMIKRSLRFLFDKGRLYIVLPLACIKNSRYLTHDSFVEMVCALGCSLDSFSHSLKLAFYLFLYNGSRCLDVNRPKRIITDLKGGMNNFSIVLNE